MGLAVLIVVVFAAIVGLMYLSCYLKRKYAQAEHWIYRALTFFMCESCKEACESHTKLLFRALLFTAVIVGVVAVTRYCR